VGRNKSFRAEARKNVSGASMYGKPETPPCATPFGELRTGLGGIHLFVLPYMVVSRKRLVQQLDKIVVRFAHTIYPYSFGLTVTS